MGAGVVGAIPLERDLFRVEVGSLVSGDRIGGRREGHDVVEDEHSVGAGGVALPGRGRDKCSGVGAVNAIHGVGTPADDVERIVHDAQRDAAVGENAGVENPWS